jgi:NAD(P)-dependent dehydrogenase (short-subunit alcohol dehydrogenase family)
MQKVLLIYPCRRQSEVNNAIKEIGKNVTGIQGDVSNLEDLDHLYDPVNQEKGRIDILFANAGVMDSIVRINY